MKKLASTIYLVALLLSIFGCRAAAAQAAAPSMAFLDVGSSGIALELELPLGDLGTALSLPLAAHPNTVVAQYGARIKNYVEDGLRAYDRQGRAYALRIESMSVRGSVALVLQVQLWAPASESAAIFSFYDSLISSQVNSHSTLIYLGRRGTLTGHAPRLIGILRAGHDHVEVDASGATSWSDWWLIACLCAGGIVLTLRTRSLPFHHPPATQPQWLPQSVDSPHT